MLSLSITSVKDDLIEYKYLCDNDNYQKMFDKNLIQDICQYLQIFYPWYQKVCFIVGKRCFPYE